MKKNVLPILALMVFFSMSFAQNNNNSQTDVVSARAFIKDTPFDIELVEIPSGTFETTEDYTDNPMVISMKSFYMGKFEVTQKQWKEVMGTYPVEFNWDDHPHDNAKLENRSVSRVKKIATPTGFIGDELPVETVSWNTIQIFLRNISEKTGHYYRLPTNAEWEYAYRSGTTTDYYFGNDTLLLGEYEWYDENSGKKTHPVGSKKPNPWGLYDMGGNVGEWTADHSDMQPYRRLYPNRKWAYLLRRVYRGSHYLHTKFAATHKWVHSYSQVHPHYCVGFRLVRDK